MAATVTALKAPVTPEAFARLTESQQEEHYLDEYKRYIVIDEESGEKYATVTLARLKAYATAAGWSNARIGSIQARATTV